MTLRIAVLGVGRIGKMHAELVARQVPGASLAMVQDINAEAAAAVGGRSSTCRSRPTSKRCSRRPSRRRRDLQQHRHPRAVDDRRRARGQGHLLREAGLARPRQGRRGAWPSVERRGVPIQIGFNRRFDAAHASVRDAVVERVDRRPPHGADHQPRPGAAADRLHRGLRRDLPRHDDPRLRHGPLRHRQRGRRGLRAGRGARRPGDRRSRRRRHRRRVLRHENGCITTIDNSRQAVYGYDQRVEAFGSGRAWPRRRTRCTHTGLRRTAAGTISPTIPYFFLDRYIPSYVEEWKAFVAYVADGGPSPVSANDGRAPLVIGLAAWKSYREGRLVRCDEIG